MRSVIVVFALLAGCSKGDDCERLVDKMWPVMKDLGKSDNALDRDKAVAECRQNIDKVRRDPTLKCMLDANDTDAVRACMKAGTEDYLKKGRKTEASLQLNKLSKNLKVFYMEKSEFPKGKAKMLPAATCCGQPNNKCAVVPHAEWAADPIWAALDFEIDEPNLFQYGYESDGKTFKAIAVGDLDCDTTMVTYVLEGSTTEGNVTTKITEPPPGAD
jgi:hypothetical protein